MEVLAHAGGIAPGAPLLGGEGRPARALHTASVKASHFTKARHTGLFGSVYVWSAEVIVQQRWLLCMRARTPTAGAQNSKPGSSLRRELCQQSFKSFTYHTVYHGVGVLLCPSRV